MGEGHFSTAVAYMQTTDELRSGQLLEHQQEPEGQHEDWDSLLGIVLLTTAQHEPSADTKAAARVLHRVSRKQLGPARSCIRHLSLLRYKRGCNALQYAAAEVAAPSRALAAAAAAPPIPWDLLAATPSLTTLDMDAIQAQHLATGAPAAASTAAPPAAVSGVLAASLRRLRCLRVAGIHDSSHLAHLGRLLGAATGLTQLALELATPVSQVEHNISCAPLLEGMQVSQPATAAPAAAGKGAEAAAAGKAAPAPAAGDGAAVEEATRCPRRMLPALRHLEVPGRFLGLLEAWQGQPEVAGQLTCLHINCAAAGEVDLQCLAACRGLQQLVVKFCNFTMPLQLPADITQVTTLTSLQLSWWQVPEVPQVVWALTQLRQLSLQSNNLVTRIPAGISCLRELRHLDISCGYVEELPLQLGSWLPQLEVLEVGVTGVEALPPGLTRLTRLGADHTRIAQVQSVGAVAGLRSLNLAECTLQPPLQPLSRLTALEDLCMTLPAGVSEDQAELAAVPGPLAGLRCLNLSGEGPVLVKQLQAVATSQQLTRLSLGPCLEQDQFLLLGQLGVLPRLRELCLGGHGMPRLGAALPWVQQQPALTSFKVLHCVVRGVELLQLPTQLEVLDLDRCSLSADQPAALDGLSRLRALHLEFVGLEQLPPWLSSLTRLEVLTMSYCHCSAVSDWQQMAEEMGRDCPIQEGWEVLAQLPVLRRVATPKGTGSHVLQHAPHLCWVW